VENATKLYFQSLVVLAAGIATAITVLSKQIIEAIPAVLIFGIPSFLIAWCGCFLFIYWEHHMLRISLDYSEKKAAEALNIKDNEIYLYHADFLGVFNQAQLMKGKFFPKSVHILFFIIGVPAGLVYLYSAYEARKYLTNPYHYYIFLLLIFLFPIALLIIHLQCFRRERRFKKHLGIISKVP
jgi:hypothetical protein